MYIVDEPTDNDGMYFTHTDYQGNLLALSNESGNVVERYAYDPWGNRRNPDNWAEAANLQGKYQYTSRGYTLHEQLDGFGLINMNGRVYDPALSRFLSPDPQLQAPGNWLNYNRYAYCLNNPMLYTDPSGEFFWAALPLAVKIAVGVGAAVGGYTGYKIGEANGASGLSMIGYTLGGAAIGGLAGYAGATVTTSFNASLAAGATKAYGSTAFMASAISGASGGAISGAISGAGFTALAGGNIDQIMEGAMTGASIGGLSGLLGNAMSFHVQQFTSTHPGYTAHFLRSLGNQMGSNIATGDKLFDDFDFGLNLGLIGPLAIHGLSKLSNPKLAKLFFNKEYQDALKELDSWEEVHSTELNHVTYEIDGDNLVFKYDVGLSRVNLSGPPVMDFNIHADIRIFEFRKSFPYLSVVRTYNSLRYLKKYR